NVNGVFKNAPLHEILDTILLSNGYGYRAVGESLVVTDLNRLGQVNPFFVSATIPVRAAAVDDVVSGASLLTTPQGRIQAIPSARSIFVLDFPDRVKMIREFAASLDAAASGEVPGGAGGATLVGPQRLEVAYMKSHYVSAESARDLITTVLSPLGRVTAMDGEDRLLVVDYAENLDIAQRVLERIDRPRPQVSIKSLIYDLSLSDIEQLGINWTSITNGSLTDSAVSSGGTLTSTGPLNSGTGTIFNSTVAQPFSDGATGGAFTLYNLGSNLSLSAIALLLQEADDSRLLASPNVTVTENEQAIIQAVSEIPFQQLTQTTGGGNIGTTAFKEAGITLEVQPKIARDLTVQMDVRPEFSRLTGFTPGENQPIIDRRTAQTTVRVANGHTLVLGGMRQRSDVGSIAGIPFLKDLRFVGGLFRSRSTDIRESELVVFITPTIVGYDSPPSSREQAVADTTVCRLAEVPPPEGCFAGAGSCDCRDDRVPMASPPATRIITEAPPKPTAAESITPPKPAPAPKPTPVSEPRKSSNDGLTYPTVVIKPQPQSIASKPRRLPPISEGPVHANAAAADGPPARTAAKPRRRLLDRYRSGGGLLR
ncbi:MAG: secretin N-terminal domain-containing protein, partial [Planctomycetota bacterium]